MYNNVINYPYIDYIIKCYVPELQSDKRKYGRVNMKYFEEAMLHPSSQQKPTDKTYERLEYLGDCVYHLIVTDYFLKRYDDQGEGFLTRLRIRIERGDSMAELTKILGLESYVQFYGISINEHILEDVFEAFLGGFYLSFGFKYTKIFVVNLLEKHKNFSELIYHDDNYKDLLLRYYHQMKWGHPVYTDGLKKTDNIFTSTVKNPSGEIIGIGKGNSKKKSEQNASKNALINLGVIINGVVDPKWIDKIEKIEEEVKEKEQTDKKPLSVFNPSNKLMKRTDIKNILMNYNVYLSNDTELDINGFYEAMTHRSYTQRKNLTEEDKIASKNAVKLQKKSNERLQFMGDAVIHFIIAEHLFHKYPNADEGFLTRLRCKLENRDSLYYLAKQTGIDSYLLVSQHIEVLHGRNNINIIGGGFEAFIGSLYLQTGLSIVRQFIMEVIRIELNINEIAENETNYKDLILQLYNRNHWGKPIYKIMKETGPDHRKIFTVGIYLNDRFVSSGTASSKKQAEQIASKIMYEKYNKIVKV